MKVPCNHGLFYLDLAEVNCDEDQIRFLQNVMLLRRLRHKHVLEIVGLCLEGSPATRAGHEVLMVTGRTHGYVTLQRLLEWCGENNPDVSRTLCASVSSFPHGCIHVVVFISCS